MYKSKYMSYFITILTLDLSFKLKTSKIVNYLFTLPCVTSICFVVDVMAKC